MTEAAAHTEHTQSRQDTEARGGGLRRLWLAALGVWPTLESSGGRIFETLVENGEKLSAEWKSGARSEESGAAESARAKLETRLKDLSESVRDLAGRGEKAFDRRVAAALERHGLPTRDEFERLMTRLDEVARRIDEIAVERKQESDPPSGT